jgi:predicted nucleic acid-binding protein
MYLLDTNVISEIRKIQSGKAHSGVTYWAEHVSASWLFLSVITVLELEVGILSVERRDQKQGTMLRHWLKNQVLPTFAERTLDINTAIARRCATLHVPDPRSDRDALIAATALQHGMVVVTRNTADFALTGVDLINPWEL